MSDIVHHPATEQNRTQDSGSPQPQKVALAELFDRSAPTYERVGVEHFADLGRRLVAHAGLAEGHRVLDVGCGTGAVLLPAAQAVGPQGEVIGVDLSMDVALEGPEKVTGVAMNVDRLSWHLSMELDAIDGENASTSTHGRNANSFNRIMVTASNLVDHLDTFVLSAQTALDDDGSQK